MNVNLEGARMRATLFIVEVETAGSPRAHAVLGDNVNVVAVDRYGRLAPPDQREGLLAVFAIRGDDLLGRSVQARDPAWLGGAPLETAWTRIGSPWQLTVGRATVTIRRLSRPSRAVPVVSRVAPPADDDSTTPAVKPPALPRGRRPVPTLASAGTPVPNRTVSRVPNRTTEFTPRPSFVQRRETPPSGATRVHPVAHPSLHQAPPPAVPVAPPREDVMMRAATGSNPALHTPSGEIAPVILPSEPSPHAPPPASPKRIPRWAKLAVLGLPAVLALGFAGRAKTRHAPTVTVTAESRTAKPTASAKPALPTMTPRRGAGAGAGAGGAGEATAIATATAAATTPTPTAAASVTSARPPATIVPALPEDGAPVDAAAERRVAEAMFAGDYARALVECDALAVAHPSSSRYGVMVRVLRAKAARRR